MTGKQYNNTQIVVLNKAVYLEGVQNCEIFRKASPLKPYTVSSETGDFWLTKGNIQFK